MLPACLVDTQHMLSTNHIQLNNHRNAKRGVSDALRPWWAAIVSASVMTLSQACIMKKHD